MSVIVLNKCYDDDDDDDEDVKVGGVGGGDGWCVSEDNNDK